MKPARLILFALYAAYLVHVGLAMLLLPWSPVWNGFIVRLPGALANLAGEPAVRGAVSAFGVLHLALAAAEVLLPDVIRRML